MIVLMVKHDRVTFPFDYTDFVGKVMSLLFNALSRFVIAFLPRINPNTYIIRS